MAPSPVNGYLLPPCASAIMGFMRALCLLIDRLHNGFLGAYGNGWVATPAFDELAAESLLCDFAYTAAPHLDRVYDGYWRGGHPIEPVGSRAARLPLAARVGAKAQTVLVTDDPAAPAFPGAEAFSEIVTLPPPAAKGAANGLDETHLAGCFGALLEQLDPAKGPSMVWAHFRGLGAPWDAPYSYRERYVEPGDPAPPHDIAVPDLEIGPDDDPDRLWGLLQAYAGQVSLLDDCLGGLIHHLRPELDGGDFLLAVASPRGLSLGEHGLVGPGGALYGELVRVPLVVRFPRDRESALRTAAFVQPADLGATLAAWFGSGEGFGPHGHDLARLIEEEPWPRDRVLVAGDGEQGLRTPAWWFRNLDPPELFAMPDDRWEVNDVADRCGAVVEAMSTALARCEESVRHGEAVEAPPLDPLLVDSLG